MSKEKKRKEKKRKEKKRKEKKRKEKKRKAENPSQPQSCIQPDKTTRDMSQIQPQTRNPSTGQLLMQFAVEHLLGGQS